MTKLVKTCGNCNVPTTAVINSAICAGWRTQLSCVPQPPADCPTWQKAGDVWSVGEATAFAVFRGMRMSKPTVIKISKEAGICRRRPHSTQYSINAEKFRQLIAEFIDGLFSGGD